MALKEKSVKRKYTFVSACCCRKRSHPSSFFTRVVAFLATNSIHLKLPSSYIFPCLDSSEWPFLLYHRFLLLIALFWRISTATYRMGNGSSKQTMLLWKCCMRVSWSMRFCWRRYKAVFVAVSIFSVLTFLDLQKSSQFATPSHSVKENAPQTTIMPTDNVQLTGGQGPDVEMDELDDDYWT